MLEVRQQSTQSIDNGNGQVQVLANNNQLQGSNSSSHVTNHVNKWVINLSSVPLTPTQESLLSKGPNFALSPSYPPNVEFISSIRVGVPQAFGPGCARDQGRNQLLTKIGQAT